MSGKAEKAEVPEESLEEDVDNIKNDKSDNNDNLPIINNIRTNFGKLTPENQAYILGFPLHLGAVLETWINDKFEEIIEFIESEIQTGRIYTDIIQPVLKEIREVVDQHLNHILTSYDLKLANSENIFFDNINKYSLFDVVSYIDGKHLYVFNRPEFQNLLKTRKNPYTNTRLPHAIIATIETRAKLARDLNLQNADIIEEFWKKLAEKPPKPLSASLEPSIVMQWETYKTGVGKTISINYPEIPNRQNFDDYNRITFGNYIHSLPYGDGFNDEANVVYPSTLTMDNIDSPLPPSEEDIKAMKQDVKVVLEQCPGVTRKKAIDTMIKNQGDIVATIMELTI